MQEPTTNMEKSANVASGSKDPQIGYLDNTAFRTAFRPASRFWEIERLMKSGDLEGARKVAGELKERIAAWNLEEKNEKPGNANF